jgi:dCTP diphosphatase
MSDSLKQLTKVIIAYRDERDWKQFHTPKNSAANIVVEAAELLEHFRWQEAADDVNAVKEEAADVLYSLLLFAHEAKIDLGAELLQKLKKNAANYPAHKAKGRATKYTAYED